MGLVRSFPSAGSTVRGVPVFALANRIVLTLAVICVYLMIWLFLNAFKTTNDMFAATRGPPGRSGTGENPRPRGTTASRATS